MSGTIEGPMGRMNRPFPAIHQFHSTFLPPSAGGNAVHLAVLRNKVAFIRLLADYGANLEMRDGDGLTPLGRAVKESPETNRLDVITELVAVGAALDDIQGMEYDEAVEEAIRRGKRLREERQ